MKEILKQHIGKEIKVQSMERGIFKIIPRSIERDHVVCDIIAVGKLGHAPCSGISIPIKTLHDARNILG